MDEEIGSNDPVDLRRDNTNDAEAQVDAAPDVAAASVAFNNAALPPDMPEWKKAAVRAEAANIRQTIQNDELRLSDVKRREDEFQDTQLNMMQFAAQERERQEWLHTSSTLAGVTMTGVEWQSLSQELKEDGALHDWLIDRMVKDGKTREEAERKVGEMADVYLAMAKPPSQRTEAEQQSIDRAKTDPDYQRYTGKLHEQQGRLSTDNENRTSVAADSRTSVDTGSDLFASAPDLSEHHRVALAATQPLTPLPVSPSPPQPAPGMAGLDI